MSFCVIAGCWLAAALNGAGPAERASVRTVVKPDARTGRLVRQVAVVPAPGTSRKQALAELGMGKADIDALVQRLAREHQMDPLLVQAVIHQESGYDPFAVSHKGAQGLMQLMPGTARQLAVKNVFSPVENIEAGVRHLKGLLAQFKGEVQPALAAYNAGAGAVRKHGGIPPYRETRDYVDRIEKRWTKARENAEASQPKAPEHPPIQHYVDENGVVHLTNIKTP